ncbi:MAG: ABC transporter permease [Atribacterota bacterium]
MWTRLLKEIQLSFRNVLRNKRRSILTALVLTIGVISLCFFGGYLESIYYFYGNSVIAKHGHFQIRKKGYSAGEKTSLKNGINKKEKQAAKEILNNYPHINVITERLNVSGIIGTEKRSTIFIGLGIVPEKELDLLSVASAYSDSFAELTNTDNILVGKILSKQMEFEKNDRVTLMSMSEYGSLEAVYALVGGDISTGITETDSRLVLGNLNKMQNLVYTDKIHSLVVLMDRNPSKRGLKNFVSELEKKFDNKNLQMDIKLWYELDDMYQPTIRLFNTIFTIITIIFLIVIGFTIANTIYMSVMERINEVGTLRAVGSSKNMIVRMFILEAAIISFLSSIIGVGISGVLVNIINNMNIVLPPYPGQSESYALKFIMNLKVIAWAFLFNLMGGVIASIIPALKAVKFKVIDAIRHV